MARRILLVEDNAAAGLGLLVGLAGRHAVAWSAGGEAALVRLQAQRFDALVIDYYMPTLDGLDVLRRAREAGVTAPAVLITAAADEDVRRLREELAGLAPAALLRKPFPVEELLAAIETLRETGGEQES